MWKLTGQDSSCSRRKRAKFKRDFLKKEEMSKLPRYLTVLKLSDLKEADTERAKLVVTRRGE